MTASVGVLPARNSVGLVFALNGLLFATLFSRIADIRRDLDLDNGALGLLLLAIAAGSVLALPSSGWLIERSSVADVVRQGTLLGGFGLVVAGVGVATFGLVWMTAVGLFAYGVGTGVWEVAMNVEGAEVERRLDRTVMPRFHAGWSLGSIAGAGVGVPLTAVGVPMEAHLAGAAGLACATGVWAATRFLPASDEHGAEMAGRSPWLEPRTLAIGVMVLAFAVVEGSANDWLSLALIDGYEAKQWVGVAGFAIFVSAMTTGRLLGPMVLDRFGRAPVLWSACVVAAAGILLVVLGEVWPVVALGIVLWGLGGSLGFPVGMSAAADDTTRAAAQVSVIATIGYGGFLAGPPLLGQLGDRVGTLDSLLVVALLMVPAAVAVRAVRL